MRTLTHDRFIELMKTTDIKTKYLSDLKFTKSVADVEDWSALELLAITDRTDDKGVLLMEIGESLYAAPYTLSRRIIDSVSGRSRAIICDFCYTWQPGSNAASISFTHARSKHTVGFLCCSDLKCSWHVRSLTNAAVVSRARLKENLTSEDRVKRLEERLRRKVEQLELPTIS